jgi:hypothetical protein
MSFLSLLLIATQLISSEPVVEKIEDSKLISLFNSLETENRYTNEDISLSIFKKSNPPGSAGISGGHEISYSFYLAVSEYDEYPAQSLFLIGGFINPQYTVETNEKYLALSVKYGVFNDRKSKTYKVTLNKVSVLNP